MSFWGLPGVLVIGGTCAQGRTIVQDLAKDGNYAVTVLTRDANSPKAWSLAHFTNVRFIEGSYENESSLRDALQGQYGVYVNFNSFGLPEGGEAFWTFRLYELAIQSGVKRFVYSGGSNHFKRRHYAEEYRCSHQVIRDKLAEWIEAQPLDLIEWTTLEGGVYTEMLSGVLRPLVLPDQSRVFAAPLRDGCIPFIDLAAYGRYVRWIFDNPSRSSGRRLSLPVYPTTLADIAVAYTAVSGWQATAKTISQGDWFTAVSARIDPDMKRPAIAAASDDDDTRFTFRQSFGAWWNVWESMRKDETRPEAVYTLADEVYPDRSRSVEEWMRRSGYTGDAKAIGGDS